MLRQAQHNRFRFHCYAIGPPYLRRMSAMFPFQLSPAPPPISPEYETLVFADVGGLEDYYALFQHFGFGGTAASWAEHLETIVEEHCPALLDESRLPRIVLRRAPWCD